jgi:hypothetical protein
VILPLQFKPKVTFFRAAGDGVRSYQLKTGKTGSDFIHLTKDRGVLCIVMFLEQLTDPAFQDIKSVAQAEGLLSVCDNMCYKSIW